MAILTHKNYILITPEPLPYHPHRKYTINKSAALYTPLAVYFLNSAASRWERISAPALRHSKDTNYTFTKAGEKIPNPYAQSLQNYSLEELLALPQFPIPPTTISENGTQFTTKQLLAELGLVHNSDNPPNASPPILNCVGRASQIRIKAAVAARGILPPYVEENTSDFIIELINLDAKNDSIHSLTMKTFNALTWAYHGDRRRAASHVYHYGIFTSPAEKMAYPSLHSIAATPTHIQINYFPMTLADAKRQLGKALSVIQITAARLPEDIKHIDKVLSLKNHATIAFFSFNQPNTFLSAPRDLTDKLMLLFLKIGDAVAKERPIDIDEQIEAFFSDASVSSIFPIAAPPQLNIPYETFTNYKAGPENRIAAGLDRSAEPAFKTFVKNLFLSADKCRFPYVNDTPYLLYNADLIKFCGDSLVKKWRQRGWLTPLDKKDGRKVILEISQDIVPQIEKVFADEPLDLPSTRRGEILTF